MDRLYIMVLLVFVTFVLYWRVFGIDYIDSFINTIPTMVSGIIFLILGILIFLLGIYQYCFKQKSIMLYHYGYGVLYIIAGAVLVFDL